MTANASVSDAAVFVSAAFTHNEAANATAPQALNTHARMNPPHASRNLHNAAELTAGLARGLDLHQQVLAANVCLQVHDGSRRPQRPRECLFDGAEIRRLPHVDFELESVDG